MKFELTDGLIRHDNRNTLIAVSSGIRASLDHQTSTFTAQKTKSNRDETDRAHELRLELAARGESAGLELNVFGFAAIPPIEHRWP
jgi:hypothetical protein